MNECWSFKAAVSCAKEETKLWKDGVSGFVEEAVLVLEEDPRETLFESIVRSSLDSSSSSVISGSGGLAKRSCCISAYHLTLSSPSGGTSAPFRDIKNGQTRIAPS
jgi:hypothetical protein